VLLSRSRLPAARGSRSRLPAVLVCQLTLLCAIASPAFAAPDPLLADQWALSDAALGAREAWTQSRGGGVVVAVLDSGVQFDHPDLRANLWTNPRELAGNHLDDDHNGFVDDVHGANLLDGSGNAGDGEGHGTHVAGIIAAVAGNGIGGAGLAPQARITSVKVLDSSSVSSASRIARGIRYAVDAGARILNVSLNGDATTQQLEDAIAYADERGATIVASAGNDGRDIDSRPSFPAASANSAVLSVTASGRRGALLSFANRGRRSVDLAAPGERILSTAWGSDYELRSGTSMAAPYVSAALALLTAARPDLTQAQLRDVLLATAPRQPRLLGLLGAGELDVDAAMHAILPGARWRTAPPVSAAAAVSRPRLRVRVATAIRSGSRATVRWSASAADNVARWTIALDGRRVATRGAGLPRVLRMRLGRPGSHRLTIVGRDAAGARVVAAARTVRVLRAR
jgi:subtilisin family serine protease